jgi:pyruvate dehydrogenase E2 component (dihydrolipoamide acetyltransferase)/2-oxoisovalerate dehydrogenase E2 component (dihydrolipoyl transacylase)
MDFRLPELGEGVYEAELVGWLVKPGDAVKRGQTLMEVMTDKATMEVPSPFAGRITALRAEPGRQVKVGDVVLTFSGADEPAGAKPEAEVAATRAEPAAAAKDPTPPPRSLPASAPARTPSGNGPSTPATRPGLPVKAAPSVRYLARKLGIDLGQVRGSGPGGRVLIEDLSGALAPEPAARKPASEPRPEYGTPGGRLKLHGLRRTIAERMVQAKRTVPHYTYVDECDVTDLVRLREGLRERFARAGLKLTYLPFFVKAAVAALKEVPLVNASLDEAAGEIVLHDRYHVGIAVATPAGLIVPVVRDADRKDLAQIAREVERLSAEARAGKARRDDLRGGTFTVTSVGNIGGLFSTPVINHPEVAILGVGKITRRPVYDAAGRVRPAEMLYLSLSFDHRVVDGAVGAVFGNALKAQLQAPANLLLPDKLL